MDMTAELAAPRAAHGAFYSETAASSDLRLLRTFVIGAGLCWALLFVVAGVGYGLQFQRNAYVRFDVVNRKWSDFYATQLVTSNPTAIDPFGQKSDVAFLVNDGSIKRTYNALQMQGQWRPTAASYVGLSYTYSRLRGNDNSETAANATIEQKPPSDCDSTNCARVVKITLRSAPQATRLRMRFWSASIAA